MAPRGTYRQIAKELRQLIDRGDLRPGDMVSSELALGEEYSVSRQGRERSQDAQQRRIAHDPRTAVDVLHQYMARHEL
ncbi:GntR family transcriptional regulator [Pseudonocardia charpentierae]|uniref:GntR family transcriptional regulator n=1 Tax=Pseudonocardia charpentierae TaxID=3075545 RepID=A0ABU2NI60_9PSEU|nr:GntR family transcriptional regulator [Pseudonocardia sp. DSM 45834]MDT0352919.1 GntR family transcriptional regulator [Pseudonocardia sp. DSM 45834]